MKTCILLLSLTVSGAIMAQNRYNEVQRFDGATGSRFIDSASKHSALQRRTAGSGANDLLLTAPRKQPDAIDTAQLAEFLRRRSPLLQHASAPTDTINRPQKPIDNMPNAFVTPGQPPSYKNNNGNGFDIYQSPIDNMPILMPDSNNRASLKMSNQPYQQVKPMQMEWRRPLLLNVKPNN